MDRTSMRPVGVRDADLVDRNGVDPDGVDLAASAADAPGAPVTQEWDFSDEPVFIDEIQPEPIPVPGRPGDYIEVQMVSDTVAKDRASFAKTQQHYRKDDRGRRVLGDSVTTSFNASGLSLFKRRHAIVGFRISNRATGKVQEFDARNPRKNEQVYASWTGRFGEWVDGEIDRVNRWTEEGEAQQERFRPDAA